jgi:hypothetical protein
MRVTAIGVKRMNGIGKESGRPFDFAQIEILRNIEVVAGEKFTLQGYGYETNKIDLANDCLSKFAEVRFPAVLDLVVTTEPGRSGLRSVVTGFTRAADLKTAA